MIKQKLKATVPFMIMALIVVVGFGFWIKDMEPYRFSYYEPGSRFERDFIDYLDNNREIVTPNQNTNLRIWTLEKDRVKNNNTNIILTIEVSNPQDEEDLSMQKEWTKHSVDTKRRDLKICADKIDSFLKSKNISYNYNVYIVVYGDLGSPHTGNYVYDAHYDKLWISNYEDNIISGETDLGDIDNYGKEGYRALIVDGKFTERNKEYSTAY